jgi:hypothetical protein
MLSGINDLEGYCVDSLKPIIYLFKDLKPDSEHRSSELSSLLLNRKLLKIT